MPAGLRVARAMLHQWEEPPISGTNGAGTVFFSGCTLRCCFCQNGSISAGGQGKDISTARLREIFDELIARGAHNIELVTPTHSCRGYCRPWSQSFRYRWCTTAVGMKRSIRCGSWKER